MTPTETHTTFARLDRLIEHQEKTEKLLLEVSVYLSRFDVSADRITASFILAGAKELAELRKEKPLA